MLDRVLEPEVMDSAEDASDYDSMDHSAVNRLFAVDFLKAWNSQSLILDVGTGTAQIPIEICRQDPRPEIVAIDLAEHMLVLARKNIEIAGFASRIQVAKMDAKGIYYHSGVFGSVISNSIIHHIPEPAMCFQQMHTACRDGGLLFVRDLLRPDDLAKLNHLVNLYAADANEHQRKLFADSLNAALTLDEVRAIVAMMGYTPETVTQTSDRHWTWCAKK